MLVHRARRGNLRTVCVREVQRSLEQSVKRLIEDKIKDFGVQDEFRVLNTHIETPDDGIIIFQGMQDHTAESLKSLEGFDVAWVEEAQSLSEKSLTLLRPTIRKEGSEIWCSWNPRFPTDPVDAFFRGESLAPGAVAIETNYRDNPHLPDSLKQEIQWDAKRDPDKYAYVWGGGYKKASEARVFKNWRVEDFPDAPDGTAFLFGGDWGYASDPTVLVRAWFRDARTLCIDHEAYEVGCEIEDTPDLYDSLLCGPACATPRSSCRRSGHGFARRWVVTADSARPETISHMRRHGYERIAPSVKGAGSVEDGVSFLKSYDIVVHPRCRHTIEELTFYSWKVDEVSGQILPVLVDKKNHVIDSLRYALESSRKAPAKTGGLLW